MVLHEGRYDRLPPSQQAFLDPVDMLAAYDPLLALAAVDPSAAVNAISRSTRFLNPAINPAAALLAFNPAIALQLALTNPAAAALAGGIQGRPSAVMSHLAAGGAGWFIPVGVQRFWPLAM